jgi:hypothetical protein
MCIMLTSRHHRITFHKQQHRRILLCGVFATCHRHASCVATPWERQDRLSARTSPRPSHPATSPRPRRSNAVVAYRESHHMLISTDRTGNRLGPEAWCGCDKCRIHMQDDAPLCAQMPCAQMREALAALPYSPPSTPMLPLHGLQQGAMHTHAHLCGSCSGELQYRVAGGAHHHPASQ